MPFKTSSHIPVDEIIASLNQLRLPGSKALVSFKGFCVCKSGLWSRGEHKKELMGVGSEIVAPLIIRGRAL